MMKKAMATDIKLTLKVFKVSGRKRRGSLK